jgi:PAS domain S-box-containing protein
MNKAHRNIEDLRSKVVNIALIAFAALAAFSDIIAFLRSLEYGFWSVFIIQSIVIAILIITAIFRRRLLLTTKVYSLAFVVIVALAIGLYGFGFLGSSKVLIAILPVFISFVLSYRKALITLFLFSLVYIIFAFLYSTGKITYSYDLYAYAATPRTWVHDYIIIFLTSWGLLYVGSYFGKALTENYIKIENQNTELRAKEIKYRTLFESSNDAIILIDNNRFFDFNNITINLFQCNKDYLIGKEPHELSPEIQPDGQNSQKKIKELFLKVILGESQIFDWQHRRPNGEIFDVSMSLNLMEIENIKYIQAVLRDISESKKIQNKILSTIIQTEEKERGRFAKEIHDGVGPLLSATKIYAKAVQKSEDEKELSYILLKLNETVDEAIISAQEIANNISPHVLQNFGLKGAIESFYNKISKTSSVVFNFHSNIEQRLGENVETTLYRVVVELINNTIKYANAKSISLLIMVKDRQISFKYSDDGIGFDIQNTLKNSTGMGLFNIESRIKLLNAQIKMQSEKQKGFNVEIEIAL